MIGEVVAWALGIATLLGGIAAILYFLDKWRAKRKWTEKDKEVDSAWWHSSELKKEYEAKRCKDFKWCNSDRVAARLQEGMTIVYEIDGETRTKYRLVNRSGQLLLCRSAV